MESRLWCSVPEHSHMLSALKMATVSFSLQSSACVDFFSGFPLSCILLPAGNVLKGTD